MSGDQTYALYVFLTVYTAGLLYPYLTSERREVVAVTSAYRPGALVMIMLHCLSFFGASQAAWLGAVANSAYVTALWLIARELRAPSKTKMRIILQEIALVFCGLTILAWITRTSALEERLRAYLVILAAAAATLGIIHAAVIRFRHAPSQYLRHVLIAATLSLAVMAVRIFQISNQSSHVMGLGHESEALFVLRLLNAVCFFVLINALTNVHFQKLWLGEARRRHIAETGALETLTALARARDHETGSHIVRTQNYVRLLASHLAAKDWFEMPKEDAARYCDLLFAVAPLHDIGKIGIPDSILLKPGRHEPAESEVMKTHTLIGEKVLSVALQEHQAESDEGVMFRAAIEIAGGHHESWDGSGYPRGLAGEAIPKSARLMAVADIYDALTTERPYKRAWSHEAAAGAIKRLSGTRLDPKVVDAFFEEEQEVLAIAQRYRDSGAGGV
jgi:HD-GYP domain-containing protein (c-di-GMP phosphodiesterase class II)